MIPTRGRVSDHWRSGDRADIIVGDWRQRHTPYTVRLSMAGTHYPRQIDVPFQHLRFLGAGQFGDDCMSAVEREANGDAGEGSRYGFYLFERSLGGQWQQLVVMLETCDLTTKGIVLPESGTDTFRMLAVTMTPDQLWDIGHVLSLTQGYGSAVSTNDEWTRRTTHEIQ